MVVLLLVKIGLLSLVMSPAWLIGDHIGTPDRVPHALSLVWLIGGYICAPGCFHHALLVLPPYSTIDPIHTTQGTMFTLGTVAGGFIWGNDSDADDYFSFVVIVVVGGGGD